MRESNSQKLDSQFLDRWSPRSFQDTPVDSEDVQTLFEAARWAPSCFNEQPWHFVYGTKASARERLAGVLVDSNRAWASKAPMLVAVFSKRSFERNGKPNRWADFDTGSAWMSFTLQAEKLGLSCHAMGGFDPDKAYAVTGLDPERFNAICMVAVGKKGEVSALPPELREKEQPSERKQLSSIATELT